MERLNFKMNIKAPKEKVWKTMLGMDTYKQWTAVFMPGSYYLGDWGEGNKIVFLAPDENDDLSGMVGKIKKNKPNEYVSIEYEGTLEEGEVDVPRKEADEWTGAQEAYTFKEKDGITEVLVEVDAVDGYVDFMKETWPQALEKLKELVEQ